MKRAIGCIISCLSFAALAAPQGTLSVHILNQQTGLPSPNVTVSLEKSDGGKWRAVAESKTDSDGRVKSLYPAEADMEPGVYKVTFQTGAYFEADGKKTFFPEVPVIFTVTEKNQKLHIPLLLSQYGYSTYRGS